MANIATGKLRPFLFICLYVYKIAHIGLLKIQIHYWINGVLPCNKLSLRSKRPSLRQRKKLDRQNFLFFQTNPTTITQHYYTTLTNTTSTMPSSTFCLFCGGTCGNLINKFSTFNLLVQLTFAQTRLSVLKLQTFNAILQKNYYNFLLLQLLIFCLLGKGQRERLSPLPKIMRSSHPDLGQSQESAHTECNVQASSWRHRLLDHGIPRAR